MKKKKKNLTKATFYWFVLGEFLKEKDAPTNTKHISELTFNSILSYFNSVLISFNICHWYS